MSFVTTAFLWGIAAVTVPLLIHLFNRRRRITVPWGAMQFLMADEKTKRRSILRVSDVLPLVLRALALIALAIAFSRPLVSGGLARNTAPRDVVIVVDNSLSTSRQLGDGGTVLDAIKKDALSILADLGPRDRPFVVATCPSPRWLTPQPDTTAGTLPSLARDAVRDLAPSRAGADFAAAISAALTNPPSHDAAPRQVVVLTEPQASGWSPDQLARWTAVRDLTRSLAGSSVETRFPAGADQPSPATNLSITSLEPVHSVIEAGASTEIRATVTNHADVASPQTTLQWTVGDTAAGLATVPSLNPGGSITISHEAPLPSAATYPLSAKLGIDDPISADNTASTVVEVLARVPVLLVTSDPDAGSAPPVDPDADGNSFFLAALGRSPSNPEARWRSVFDPAVITLTDLPQTDLAPFTALVLSDPGELDAGHADALRRFVSAGGGLWVAPGPNTDVRAYNRHLHAAGTGPSPVVIDPASDAGGSALRLAVPTPPHDAVTLFSDPRFLDLPDARIKRAFQFRRPLPEDAAPLLTFPGSPLPAFAVTRTFDAGRVIVQSAPLGTSWGNLPALSLYVPLVNEWLWYLTAPAMTPRNLEPGTPLLDPRLPSTVGHGSTLTVTFPDGSALPSTVTSADGKPAFRFTSTAEPGLYTLTFPSSSPATPPAHFTVSRDPAESDLAPLSPEQVATIADLSQITFPGTAPAGASDPAPDTAQESAPAPLREPAWGWFFLLLLVFLALESIVSLVTRHRRARASRTVFSHA